MSALDLLSKTTAAPRKRGAAVVPSHTPADAVAASFAALTDKLDYLEPADVELVRRAYRVADRAHLGQLRDAGEPYITHPIAVAAQCALWKLDAPALMAALLHDVLEDSSVSKAELAREFGTNVAELVDGLTKLEQLEFSTREQSQAESFGKMLLAMARDVRVILIKLADRSHNMRTLAELTRERQLRIAQETLDVYAPIAHRLGLNESYRELQDLAFTYLHPWRVRTLQRALERARRRRRDLLDKVQNEVNAAMGKAQLAAQVQGREKTLYSVYRKMKGKHLNFAQVHDLYGFRVVVPDVAQCYAALGVLHQLYKPIPGRFKDHIAIAKVNGYQSLHTTVLGPAGVAIEFQIRTRWMHLVAEAGVAAHWLYKAGASTDAPPEGLGAQWLQSLLEIRHEAHDAAEFWHHIKIDLSPDAVYVFTPKGRILALPRGATVVDYAYAIHSDIGDRAVAARVNGSPVALRAELRNGDNVEIITATDSVPNPAWLGFVRTGRARSKIRHYLKTLAHSESQQLGRKLLAQALRGEGFEALPDDSAEQQALWEKLLRFTGNKTQADLLADLGLGRRIATLVAKRLAALLVERGQRPDAVLLSRERYNDDNAAAMAVQLDGSESASISYASCCHPVPGDAITGYLGRGEGLAVHRAGCANAQRLHGKDSERFIAVEWAEQPARAFQAGICVSVRNGQGVLARVAAAIAAAKADIAHVDMGQEAAQETTDLNFLVAVQDTEHLDKVLQKLERTASVHQVKRR